MNACNVLLAMGQGAPAGPGGAGSNIMLLGWMVIIFALFYVMIVRPQKRKEKERKALIASIQSGDRVVFSGGIIGMVTNVKEQAGTFVVKVDDKVKLEILRGAVLRVLAKDETPAAAEEP